MALHGREGDGGGLCGAMWGYVGHLMRVPMSRVAFGKYSLSCTLRNEHFTRGNRPDAFGLFIHEKGHGLTIYGKPCKCVLDLSI